MVKAIFKLLRFPNEGPQKNKLIPIDVNFKMNLETKKQKCEDGHGNQEKTTDTFRVNVKSNPDS